MARQPTLVQLSSELVAALDQRAASTGRSRSELIRMAIEAYLAADRAAAIDRQIVEGYSRLPPGELDRVAGAARQRLIREEPW
jgi:metal-responsive CopG/Arc/MetJ family transcriptional regulator